MPSTHTIDALTLAGNQFVFSTLVVNASMIQSQKMTFITLPQPYVSKDLILIKFYLRLKLQTD